MTRACPDSRATASALDQHWTPPDMIEILARHFEAHPLPAGPVTEPFAGAGRLIAGLARVIPPTRWRAIEVDPKYRGGLEALGVRHDIGDAWTWSWEGHVVTNPPFGRSLVDVLHRCQRHLEAGHCAIILCTHRALTEPGLGWMPAPSEVLHPRWRPAFGGARAGLPGTCWAVWRPGHNGATSAWYVDRPETSAQGVLL